MPKFPFEVAFEEIQANPDPYISSVCSSLESEFLVLPKGVGFVDYSVFETGYEALKKACAGFKEISTDKVLPVILSVPISFIVLRSMLGFTPPEWAYVTTQRTEIEVTQGFARSLDRNIRMAPLNPIKPGDLSLSRLRALVETACELLNTGAPEIKEHEVHRLGKADTKMGSGGIQTFARIGVPYAALLYERFMGRPFASHRDSVSELIGDSLEVKIEKILAETAISYRKIKRAERIEGFDQAPDFIIPSEFNAQVVIEAKITEDDGTARDKITRIQHLHELSVMGRRPDEPKFEVVGCISGRGFGVRHEDMKKLLFATRGKVFTLKTLDYLVECTRLREFRAK